MTTEITEAGRQYAADLADSRKRQAVAAVQKAQEALDIALANVGKPS